MVLKLPLTSATGIFRGAMEGKREFNHWDPDEAEMMYVWLTGMCANLRSTGPKFAPYRDVTSWCYEEIYCGLLEEMKSLPREVISLVSERASSGRWPKIEQLDRFWMRKRFEWAIRLCRSRLESVGRKLPPKCRCLRSTDVPEATEWLLLECWDTLGASYTLMENIDDWFFQSMWVEPEHAREWSDFQTKVQAGDFLHHLPDF